MEGMTRRKWLAAMGSLPLLGGVATLAARRSGLWGGAAQPRFQPAGDARAVMQQRYLKNVPLVTQDGKTVRFYDDLVKDKKVILTFIDTQIQPESAKVAENLSTLQQFFGSRVGKDIHMYSITQNPQHDTPAVLNSWAQQYDPGPGWLFLTGEPANVETLRQSLGFVSPFPGDEDKVAFSIAALRHGVEPEMRWAHCQSQALPEQLAHAILEDFGADPDDPNPPPTWDCTRIIEAIA